MGKLPEQKASVPSDREKTWLNACFSARPEYLIGLSVCLHVSVRVQNLVCLSVCR